MTLTASELVLVADEIRALAAGARVQKIGQPDDDRLVVRLFQKDEERALLIVTGPPYPRAHFVAEPPPNPRTPPPFCEVLRAALMPGRLFDAATLPGDRVLVLAFDVLAEGIVVRRTLYAELFGRRPNLVLVDEHGKILAALDERAEGERPAERGAPYRRPPEPPRSALVTKTPWAEFGPEFRPAGLGEGGLSRALEAWFTPRETAELLALARRELAQELAKGRKKLEKLAENVAADRRALERIPGLRAEGELLKANLAAVKRGAKTVELEDWSSGAAVRVRVALDPSKSALENAQARFAEARRLERSAETSEARAGAALEKLAAYDAAATEIERADDREAVRALREEFLRRGLLAPPPPPPRAPAATNEPAERKCYRVFTSADGLEILVGRTADDNDELTFRVANGDDFWFHVRDYPGSHVVVRSRPELPPETLLDAATLAVHFSRAEFAGKRDVSWTRRKRVQKARHAPAGQVLLSEHKTLHLRCDPERLQRLLGKGRV
jgi:predicted ribosome quality control (RQC) complex YloA/Tae2 family protein